ncbi:hypothetical protein B0H15DRAFT_995274 [Mycena belliarum]|uniref:Uncharacterized protein n=1 Tax=Mycena belliarum TaxID=1033014 RepID=A0AAD6XUG0_9AGAR|nr:hypothetical protein B0H15DRAFT_995274 [Mycena belliae]
MVGIDISRLVRPRPTSDISKPRIRLPLAPPALRELNLRLPDLVSVLKIGFCDTVVESLAGWVFNGESEEEIAPLLDVLFPGVGPLVICDFLNSERQQIEFHDDSGRIRRVGCHDRDSYMSFHAVWEYLSINHDLHKTVRELRLSTSLNWSEYIDAFQLYPPVQDSITLVIDIRLGDWGKLDAGRWTSRKLRISGLRKIKILYDRSWMLVRLMTEVLNLIDLPAWSRKIEVCISDETPEERESLSVALLALQTALTELTENCVVCAHCLAAWRSHPGSSKNFGVELEGGQTS